MEAQLPPAAEWWTVPSPEALRCRVANPKLGTGSNEDIRTTVLD